jgi:hypothetical protein
MYAVSSTLTMFSLRPRLTPSSPASKREKVRKDSRPGVTAGTDGSDTEPDAAGREPSFEVDDDNFRKPEWYAPGMYIKIFAPNEKEIDEKEFIILDSKNMAGKAVRVDELSRDKLKSGSTRNAVAVMPPQPGNSDEETRHTLPSVQTSGASTKVTQIFLEELGPDCKAPVENRYARLDHTYNIPFSGHKCDDLGIIDRPSLRKLRLQYIKHLAASWDIEDDVGKAVGQASQAKQSNSSTNPSVSSKASEHTSRSGSGRKTDRRS